uniref:Uncharacterized protein n=1 Tax=Oryza sativa subsp. japonica TaxID=39947 RepID=Q6Z6N0_ORYSJ|nr:hypothetical protein [Oryza sativa Japonica Group]
MIISWSYELRIDPFKSLNSSSFRRFPKRGSRPLPKVRKAVLSEQGKLHELRPGSRDVMAQGWCPAAGGSVLPACPGGSGRRWDWVGGMVGLGWLGTSWDPGSGCQFGLNHRRPWVKAGSFGQLSDF